MADRQLRARVRTERIGLPLGWRYDIERDGKTRTARVEVADTGMMAESIDDDEAGRALQTQGRSAVESVLGEDDPPGRLVVSTYGVTSG